MNENLSHDDIRETIRFYETPTGRRGVKALPLITQELMMVGQKWGRYIAQKAVQKLEEKGYE